MATMIEKFKERKKAFENEMEEIQERAHKMMDDAASRFTKDYESLAQSASEEDFREFIKSSDEDIDEVDRVAAMVMRVHGMSRKPEPKDDPIGIIMMML